MNAPLRVALSESTTASLRHLSAKTGLSPNIVSRFAMCASLEMPDHPVEDSGASALTINQSSLFGELEPFLMAILVNSTPREISLSKRVAGHIARGVKLFHGNIDSLEALVRNAVS